jgi:four helix bundle protein
MKYNRFEELPVWKAAVDLAVGVFKFTSSPIFRRYYSVRNQLERSSMSVSNNIAEGFERGTTPELLTFLYIAVGHRERRDQPCPSANASKVSVI